MPFSYSDFLDACSGSVDASTMASLRALSVSGAASDVSTGADPDGAGSSGGSGRTFLRKWNAFYGALMASINSERMRRLGLPDVRTADRDFYIDRVAGEAFAAKNPLEAEKVLLRAEFEHLDSLTAMHYFDADVLFGYAVKLRLLERQRVFTEEKGRAEFDRLFQGIQAQIGV